MNTTEILRAGLERNVAANEREEEESISTSENCALVGTSFVNNIWYYALPSSRLKPGQTVSKKFFGDVVLLGRDRHGKVFAMQDICPHQAMPLSDGKFDGESVECPFHGWKFGTDGVCTDIPSLVADQCVNLKKIKAKSYHCREQQDGIWIFYGTDNGDLPEIPFCPGFDRAYDTTTITLTMPVHQDFACLALIDVAHVPYIHKSWWWRSARNMKEKAKRYAGEETGWTMVKHKPSKGSVVFKLLGDHMETEISFRLPACRREYITFLGRTLLGGYTTCTPIDDETTEVNHTTFWAIPFIKPFFAPLVKYFTTTFLAQDRAVAERQSTRLIYKPRLIYTIKDAGTPGSWYLALKREWNAATAEGRKFVNPIKEKVLRWRT